MNNTWQIILAILGSSVFGSLVTYFLTSRQRAVQTAGEEIDNTSKAADLIKEMQGQIVDLYKQNTELEKARTDKEHLIEVLTGRLTARDAELATNTKQLELLRNLATQAPITEALRGQLNSMNTIIVNLQAAHTDAANMLKEKEIAFQELLKTNRDLVLQKPPKKES